MADNQLIQLYGEKALDSALNEIQKLKQNSNIPFTSEYTKLGISFMMIKATQILENKRHRCSLRDLVSESFGEAAIYTYNIKN